MTNTADNDFQKLVYARIQALPDGTTLSIGGSENLSKQDLLRHVQSGDDIGQKMMEIEKEFFQTLRDGSLYTYDD